MTTNKMSIRRLSSLFSFFYKFIFSLLFFVGFGLLAIAKTFDFDEGVTKIDLIPLFGWLVLNTFLYWSCWRIKRVQIDKKFLYISNYFYEIKVPLKNVKEVSENILLNTRPIKLKFDISTNFGSSIVFIPKIRWFALFSSNPMVNEIEKAVRSAKRSK